MHLRNNISCLQLEQLGGHASEKEVEAILVWMCSSDFESRYTQLAKSTQSLRVQLLERLKKGEVNQFRHFVTLFRLTSGFGSSSCA